MVYEPHKALEGLQGVGFQGKNCFTKKVSNVSKINYGFTKHEKINKKNYMTFCICPKQYTTDRSTSLVCVQLKKRGFEKIL